VEIARTCLRQVGKQVCDQLASRSQAGREPARELVRDLDRYPASEPLAKYRNGIWPTNQSTKPEKCHRYTSLNAELMHLINVMLLPQKVDGS